MRCQPMLAMALPILRLLPLGQPVVGYSKRAIRLVGPYSEWSWVCAGEPYTSSCKTCVPISIDALMRLNKFLKMVVRLRLQIPETVHAPD